MALSADQAITRSAGDLVLGHVDDAATIYGGALCQRNASGLIIAASDCGTYTVFAGIARAQACGATSDNDNTVELWQSGVFELPFQGTATEASTGAIATLYSDSTVSVSGTTTDDIACGKIVEYVSASVVRVRIDGYAF